MIETIEISHIKEEIKCPFCEKAAIKFPIDDQVQVDPCEHLLFVCTDYGFEFRSEKFIAYMVRKGIPDSNVKDESYDEFTSSIDIPGTLKYAAYAPSPSFFGKYFGFAPAE